MFEFEINDMTCGHCVAAITKAINDTFPGATVDIDLASHRVRVKGASDADAIANAIQAAGYSPIRQG